MPEVRRSGCVCCEGGGGVETTCCESTPVPEVLTGTVVAPPCGCLDSPYVLTYDPDQTDFPGDQAWYSDPQCTMANPIILRCISSTGVWELTYSASDIVVFRADLSSCDPLELVFDVSFDSADTCGGAGSSQVVITE